MIKTVTPTLYRDLSALLIRRLFWFLLALLCCLCGILFFYYFDSYLKIQPVLRAKNISYGITDIVIVPYFKLIIYIAILIIASLSSRLYYLEKFSPFSQLYRSTCYAKSNLIVAKLLYIKLLVITIIIIMAMPVLASGLFFEYDTMRIIILLIGQFILLFSVGLLTLVFSQIIAYSILVVLITILLIILPELATMLIIKPIWVVDIIAFFSPISHINRIAVGVINISDIVFFTTLILLLVIIAIRQFNNTYFFTN